MRTLREVLEHPPYKKVRCERCNGSVIVNRRGMILSDDCPSCSTGTYPPRNTGTVLVTDYEAWEAEVRQVVVAERRERMVNDV